MVTLPDIRQTDGYECGTVVRDMILGYRGMKADGCCVASEIDGYSPDSLELALRLAGLPVMAGTMTIDRLRYFTNRESSPVACPLNLYGGHWIVVVGVDRKKVHYHDPMRGPSSLKIGEFDSRWQDVTRRAHTFDHWGIVA